MLQMSIIPSSRRTKNMNMHIILTEQLTMNKQVTSSIPPGMSESALKICAEFSRLRSSASVWERTIIVKRHH